jgi:uncharacterized membrane protein (DUF106 family)
VMFGMMALSLLIAFSWNSVPIIKESVHSILDPSFGVLLNWNPTYGMLILVFAIALITTLVQKFATDQEAIRELKQEQREMQKEIKQFKHDPQKMMELNKKNMERTMEISGKLMSLTMKGSIFTLVPFILLFRWFMDFFAAIPEFRFFGFITWFWFYLIFVMVFSSFLRKWLKVA